MARIPLTLLGVLTGTLFAVAGSAQDERERIDVGLFSREVPGGLPGDWKPLTFEKIPKHTHYELVRDGDQVVVRAQASASASGLIRDVRIDPREYPIIQWRWKIANVLERADLTRKDGDDYPARLYLVFRSDREQLSFWEKLKTSFYGALAGQEPPTGALNYIWDAKAPKGTIAPNAYTGKVRMIVVESGTAALDRWVTEERNLLDDYRAAFGKEAPPLVGIAIMTDTDNTGESATAWYGDISLRKAATPGVQ